MGVRVEWVRYGRDAADALRSAVGAAKAAEPLAPVAVVVPSNHVGVASRRLLASEVLGPVSAGRSGIAAVTFLTPYRLAELFGAAPLAAGGRRPVSTPVVAAAVRAALAEAPGVFGPVATHPATETAMVAAYRELRDVSAPALDSLAASSARAADVVRLHRSARARLELAWYDEEDLIGSAIEAIGAGGRAVRELGTVIVYLPQRLSRHGARLLSSVAGDGDLRVLAGTTGDPRADGEVVRSVGRLGGGATLGTEPPVLDPLAMVGPGETTIVTCSDADEEVRAAIRAVVDAARAGTPLDRMAILHGGPEPYARLAHEQLVAAGIGHNGTAVMPLSARVAGRTLLHLLALPDGGFRRDDVFAWLAGAPLRRRGRPVAVTAWERISRDAGVVAGRSQWDRLLATFASEREAAADRVDADADAPPWRADRLRNDAAIARELRAFVLRLVDELAAAAGGLRPWAERATWARRLLHELLGDEGRRQSWPPAERSAAERVERALDRLSGLDSVEGPVGLDVFTRTLALELDTDAVRVGRIGDGVLVGPVGMGVGLDLDLVVVLGLAEGVFPGPTRDDSLLPDHERAATGDELSQRSQRVEREHRELLAALAGAARHVLCVPRGDLRRSNERVPSRWVLQVAGALGGGRWWPEDLARRREPWLHHVASYDDGLRRLAFPATEQEHRLRSLMAARRPVPSLAMVNPDGDPTLAAGAEVVAARRSDRFTRFDGNLAGLTVPSPADGATSATRLEHWAKCPFAYLMGEILGVDEVENPEDELQISPLNRGSLVHEALERFITEVLARPPGDRPGPTDAWTASDRALMATIGEDVCGEYEARGATGRAIFWRREKPRILDDLAHFLDADDVHRATRRARPVAAELAFGVAGSVQDVVAIPIPGGRAVRFRGRADRVDAGEDGTLYVIDYKTGRSDDYRALSADDPDLGGRRLQLPVYGQAARAQQGRADAEVLAEYWFVSRDRGKRVGYLVTADVVRRVGRTVGLMVDGIEAGVFPNNPTATSTTPWVECPFCDPDALGVVELRSRTQRKLADPAMGPFVGLSAGAPDAGAPDPPETYDPPDTYDPGGEDGTGGEGGEDGTGRGVPRD